MRIPYGLPLPDADYFIIENALMATAKGRDFLRAYLERNRGIEVSRLLQSIARLHRATAGEPAFAASIHRDLVGVLHNMRHLREAAVEDSLGVGLQQVEASLMALTEVVEDRWSGDGNCPAYEPSYASDGSGRDTKLIGELASLFAAPSRFGSTV